MMKQDPARDIGFQRMFASIIKEAAASSVLLTSDHSEEHGEELDEEGRDILAELRTDFVWKHCFLDKQVSGASLEALRAFAPMRDTPAVQRFLRVNPQFFEKIDRGVFKVAVLIRREEKTLIRSA